MDSNTMDLARSLLRPDEISRFQQLSQQLQRSTSQHSILESACSTSHSDSYWPLVAFCCIVDSTKLSTFELCRSFWRCWTCLPEECKAGRGSDAAHQLIHRCLWLCNNSYESFIDLLHPNNTSPAIINPDTGRSITHQSLTQVLSTFRLPIATIPNKAKPVVAISLPNGSLLATVLLATASYFTAAPVAYGNGVGAEQFKRDVLQSVSNLVIASSADVDRLELRSPWLAQAHIRVILVDFSSNQELTFTDLDGRRVSTSACPRPLLNRAGDIAILLFTSGTSGSKKLVPLHVESLVTGVAMVQSSWGLTSATRCLNQMPLNHVGGIVRNLFAPIMSGGSVICCSGFDANSFWDIVDDHAPTWYYASPTMHQCILEAGSDRPESVQKSQINLVCNAAGALLPSLAKQLRDTFSKPGLECTVLPSYGMTECMPISTPPLTYKLEKTGTSGVSVGPEITILDGNDKPMKNGEVGRIAVRGAPVFAGYLKDGNLDRSCFTRDGWFDTGDMGYLDESAFLYITGRSKEVINRGGELISPFEVEDAVLAAARNPDAPIFGRISKTLAFSVNHDVLQEVVGLIVVSPPGSLRPCLKTIQESTKSSLASVKQPVLLVFMNDDVPTNNNKVLRIKLAERLGLPTISDATPSSQRYYEAICPPINTPLTTKIRCEFLHITHQPLFELCREAIPLSQDFCIRPIDNEITPELWLAPQERRDPVKWTVETVAHLQQKLAQSLDSYLVPSRLEYIDTPFIRRADGSVDADKLSKPKAAASVNPAVASGAAAAKIIIAFAETLGIPAASLDESSDFFELGGDSMKAGRLLSALRKAFSTRLAIDVLFANSTVSALAALLGDKTVPESTDVKVQRAHTMPATPPGCDTTRSSTNIILLFVQLIPICIIAPMLRAMTWSIFIYCLTFSQDLRTSDTIPGRFVNLVVSLLIGKTVTETIAPIIAVIFKWLVIGRYREGLFPMWGFYHTRWWFVEKVLSIGGMGIYEHFSFTRTLYYRSLGAQIGSRVVIDKEAKLGEYDLISIGDDVVLDACTVRPFAAERNTSMYLGKIHIGMGASVGLKSIVAAGTIVPAGSCIGPNSSSWEVKDADEANRDLSASKVVKPNMVLEYMVGIPLTLLVSFIGAIPWMGGLMPLVITEPKQEQSDMLREVTIWFSSPYRVCFHYVALACNVTLGPIFFFLVVVLIKKIFEACCGGKVRPGPGKNRSQMDKLRISLIRTLMPDKQFHKLTNLFGTHYAATSFFARMLGAKIGKHVYWPGKGPSTQDWDMLEIGDSVVFGSRSHIVTSDGTGTNRVKIGAASMVADRVVLLPGVELGERAVMGSGALTRRNKLYPADTTWVGSKENDAVCLKAETVKSNQISDPHLGHRADTYRQTLLEPVSLAEYLNPSQRPSPAISRNTSPVISRNNSSYDVESYSQEQWHAKSSRIHSLAKSTITIHSVSVGSDDDVDGKKLIAHSSNSTPFARAFYQGLAPYRVWGQFTIALYSTFITILTAVFWNIHSITAIQVVAWLFKRKDYQKTFLRDHSLRPIFIYLFFAALIAIIMAVQILIVLSTIVAAKWILMGRRKQGNYDWDKSSYCQRWQLFLKIESLRQKCYRGNGILGLLSGTYWIVLYFRALGATIGKDCALFASGTPSLYFTEPDLLTLGDRVSVDDASLVCHINTRGKFDLNPLSVGDRSVLRTGSRLLSGAKMEDDTCLLEHTLVMAGDVVDAETTRQGWPSEEFKGNRLPTLRVAYHWEKVRK